eukprot:10858318-Lingulodinium_polyedra.AAC.1
MQPGGPAGRPAQMPAHVSETEAPPEVQPTAQDTPSPHTARAEFSDWIGAPATGQPVFSSPSPSWPGQGYGAARPSYAD